MERKIVTSMAIFATFALTLLICIVVNLASSSDGMDPTTQAPSIATTTMRTTTTTRRPSPADIQTIYVASGTRGLKAYSLATSRLQHIDNSSGVHAVAYDSIRQKVYWARSYNDGGTIRSVLNQAGPTGNNVQTLANTPQYGYIFGLAFDWIANVIYAVSLRGHVVACSPTPFRCATIVTRGKNLEGIAVDPVHGLIYCTEGNRDGIIFRSGTDGSNPVQLVAAQSSPRGIVIDFEEWRLYWTTVGANQILSSDMDGRDIHTIQLTQQSTPQGIALWGNIIYWTGHFSFNLESIGKDGEGNRTLCNVGHHLYHLAVLPTANPPSSRINHCESASCSGVCVLSNVSFHCLR